MKTSEDWMHSKRHPSKIFFLNIELLNDVFSNTVKKRLFSKNLTFSKEVFF